MSKCSSSTSFKAQAPIPRSSSFHSRPICALIQIIKLASNQINRSIMNTNDNRLAIVLRTKALLSLFIFMLF